MKRRHFILLLGGAGSGAMSVGSQAFSSVEAERGVNVNVVEDKNAFVGYDTSDESGIAPGDDIDLVTISNQFGENQDLKVTEVQVAAEEGSFSVSDIDRPTIGTGNDVTITATVDTCENNPTVSVTVSVEATGVHATVFGDTETRQFDVECIDPIDEGGIDSVRFKGKGNVEVEPGYGQTTVTYWRTSSTGNSPGDIELSKTEDFEFDASQSFQQQTSVGTPGIVAIYFQNENETYYHPEYDIENGTLSNWGSGQGVRREGEGIHDS